MTQKKLREGTDEIRRGINMDPGIEELETLIIKLAEKDPKILAWYQAVQEAGLGLEELNGDKMNLQKTTEQTREEMLEKLCNQEMRENSEIILQVKYKAPQQKIDEFNRATAAARELRQTEMLRQTLPYWEGRCRQVFSNRF